MDDRIQLGGGVMLLVKNSVHHDQFILPNVVTLETIAICLHLQNNIRLFLFLIITHPPPLSCTLTSIFCFFSSFDCVVLVSDLNCKHTARNCISVDRNGWMLLSVYPKILQSTTLITPHTFLGTSNLVSFILLSQSTVYCPNHCLSPPPTLSSDLDPVIFTSLCFRIWSNSRLYTCWLATVPIYPRPVDHY